MGKLASMLRMPMRMLLLAIAGWLNEEQREKIEFLQEQVRVLQELNGGKRSVSIAISGERGPQNLEGLGRTAFSCRNRSIRARIPAP